MGHLVSSVHLHIEDFLADQYSSEDHPNAGKVVGALALVGVYCFNRNLYRHSRSLAKYSIHASKPTSSTSMPARYGTPAWAMILNSVDSLGNAYCHHLGAVGFDLILCGPQIDLNRMEGQAHTLKQRYKVRIHVLVVDYNNLSANGSMGYQEIADELEDYEICILINN